MQLNVNKSLIGAFALLVLITACEEEVKEKKIKYGPERKPYQKTL